MHALQEAVDVCQHAAVLDADQHQRLPAAAGSTLQFHRVGLGIEHRACDAHAALVQRRVACAADVEHAARLVQQEGVAVLVQHVRRHGVGRAAVARAQRLDVKALAAHADQHPALARAQRAQRPALGHLARVPGGASAGAAHQRHRRQHGGVCRAAAQHDVGTGFEGSHIGLGPHQGDDALAGPEEIGLGRQHGGQRCDQALLCGLGHLLGVLLGVQQRDAWRQSVLARDFQRDVAGPVQRLVAARGAAGSDQQRDAGLFAGAHQDRQIGLDRRARILRHTPGQVGRAAVGGPSIAGDRMRASRNAAFDIACVNAQAQRADGHQDDRVLFLRVHAASFVSIGDRGRLVHPRPGMAAEAAAHRTGPAITVDRVH